MLAARDDQMIVDFDAEAGTPRLAAALVISTSALDGIGSPDG